MVNKQVFGQHYKLWWSPEKALYIARALGTNVPEVSHPVKEQAMIAMETSLQEKSRTSDEDLQPLLALTTLPSLPHIVPVARARGVSSASQLWLFVEYVQKLWREQHTYEADWDIP